MSSPSNIYSALRKWVELVAHPQCQVKDRVADLQRRLDVVSKDPTQIPKELIDGEMWGGMGSFIDCASLDPFAVPPTAGDSRDRAAQWQKIHAQTSRWKRYFNEATIALGRGLLEWCASNETHLESWQSQMIAKWVQLAISDNNRPFEPLKPEDIQTLEHNLGWHDARQ